MPMFPVRFSICCPMEFFYCLTNLFFMNQFAFYYFFTNFGNKTLKIIDMNKFFKLTSLALLCFSCTDSYDEFSLYM